MLEKERIFLVCRSKNCTEAKRTGVRCTISRPLTSADTISTDYARSLNERKLCIVYTTDFIIARSNTPNWKVSPDKPGQRKQLQKAQESEQNFYTENPDFLEL